jgi:hypothetical protein
MMLSRADPSHELSGFDAATFPGADDVDLCWARASRAPAIVAIGVCATGAIVAEALRRTTPPSDVRAHAQLRDW